MSYRRCFLSLLLLVLVSASVSSENGDYVRISNESLAQLEQSLSELQTEYSNLQSLWSEQTVTLSNLRKNYESLLSDLESLRQTLHSSETISENLRAEIRRLIEHSSGLEKHLNEALLHLRQSEVIAEEMARQNQVLRWTAGGAVGLAATFAILWLTN